MTADCLIRVCLVYKKPQTDFLYDFLVARYESPCHSTSSSAFGIVQVQDLGWSNRCMAIIHWCFFFTLNFPDEIWCGPSDEPFKRHFYYINYFCFVRPKVWWVYVIFKMIPCHPVNTHIKDWEGFLLLKCLWVLYSFWLSSYLKFAGANHVQQYVIFYLKWIYL